MANVVVKDNHLTFNNVAYFRGHAEEVQLGSIGEKRTPLFKANYLEVKDRIPCAKFAVAQSTITEIDFTRTSKAAFQGKLSKVTKDGDMEISAEAAFETLKSGHLKLVKFAVLNNDMRSAANNSSSQLRDLIRWGDNARIAHQVFIVMEASLANQFNNNVSVTLSDTSKGFEAQVSAGWSSSGQTKVTISQGTCFAYLLVKIKWDAQRKNKRTKIVDLNDDQWGSS